GQYYLRDRYYDAGVGRFTRRDVYEGRLGEPITLHKYLYGNGNPVSYTDPSGLLAGTLNENNLTLQLLADLLAISIGVAAITIEKNRNCPYRIDENHIFYPDTKSGSLEGFHSVARTIEGIDYSWVTEPPDEMEFEPFFAKFEIPDQPEWGDKNSTFFPTWLRDQEVLNLIGEAYIKSGCRPSDDWEAIVISPITRSPMRIRGGAINYFIKTAFPVISSS
ncbi:MAG: RHS repeat-associated core domain-containing protein, partial [Oscillatoria sp. PMC 1051.18]|nr:RHS repeat-associated core domain-containing protein [Oscillatoria sp. PMC 1050.18]MEC5032837.1 RHS repeat-associated core domain-containing protein [Oscillatoria sp. PMC 1051.18]